MSIRVDLSGLPTIQDEAELVALVGEPLAAVRDKVQPGLGEADREFLAAASLCFVATRGPEGGDVSPKGDPPGFTVVLDERTIAIPERSGNRRVDGFRNLLHDPQVALLFVVPGLGYTLRVNGRARLVTDGPFFDVMEHRGHQPLLAMVVEIDEVFNHCPKAFLRSGTWRPETWSTQGVRDYATLAKEKWRRDDPAEDVAAAYDPVEYEKGLYPRR